ncbi:hypothetical protein [Aeromonas dhakensis]|uniref:hypothetical protein n=1 Tax=Aeromonas dhakensis TaxID=196024 RepID=UPI00300DD05F
MTISFKFVWLDDKPDRANGWQGGLQGELLGNTVDAQLEVIAITETLLRDGLNDLSQQWSYNPPNLIMMDHNFASVAQRPFDLQGSALAHLIRIRFPKIPIVCVSGQSIQSDDFSIEDMSEYTDMFDVNTLSDEKNQEHLFAIANDFNRLFFPPKSAVREALIDVLQAPDADRESLLRIMPEEIEGTYVHGSSPHRIARWMLSVLMKRPGFLYDELEAATFVGLNKIAFQEKTSEIFSSARYKGPFATDSRPLWWATAMADALYSALPDSMAASSQLAGRELPGINPEDYSICAHTGQSSPPPDVVAYTDASNRELRPVSRQYTEIASTDSSAQLGFPGRLRIRNDRRGA